MTEKAVAVERVNSKGDTDMFGAFVLISVETPTGGLDFLLNVAYAEELGVKLLKKC